MASEVHVIQKQYLHVELNGTEADGYALQQNLPGLCEHWLTPAIERVLERHAPREGHLYIKRLDIDVGTITLRNLEQDLPDIVTQVLGRVLREQAEPDGLLQPDISGNARRKTGRHAINEALIHFLRTGTLPWLFHLPDGHSLEQAVLASWQDAQSGNEAGNGEILRLLADASVRKRLVRQFSPALLEMLLSRLAPAGKPAMERMLQTVRNPSVMGGDRKVIEQILWEMAFAALAAGRTLELRELAAECWQEGINSGIRLAPSLTETLLDLAFPEGSAAIDEVVKALGSSTVPVGESEHFGMLLRESAFTLLAAGGIPATGQLIGEAWLIGRQSGWRFSAAMPEILLTLLAPEIMLLTDRMLQALRDAKVSREGTEYFRQLLQEMALDKCATEEIPEPGSLVADAWSALPVAAQRDAALAATLEHHWPGATSNRAKTERPGVVFKAPDRIGSAAGKTSAQDSENIVIEEGGYVENAGLVLLHLFLPQFFTVLGIADDNRLLNPERALCLLHYLASGQSVAPEYELVLPKILCNVPLDTPVASDVALTDGELKEAKALLEAVIRHWDVLRNTTPDGLRGAFLLRPGKVSLRGDDWLLQIESRTCDILLDQLPWGIGTIRLPWMTRMLWVEWR